jgi:multiple sugar transport system permease protein
MNRNVSMVRPLWFVLLIGYGLVCLFPFCWAFLVALAPLTAIPPGSSEAVGVDIMKWPPGIDLWGLKVFGAPATLGNFFKIFEVVPNLGRWVFNTVGFALVVSTGVVFFNTLAAYAFARLRFPLRDFWFSVLLASMMVPFPVTMIPVYNLLVGFDWVNTYQGLIIPKLINVAILFFMRQFFLQFPVSLEEAAYMDGASIPRIVAKVVIPNSRPAVAAQMIYVLLGTWNEFLWPLIVTSHPDMYTLTMGLNFFKSSWYTYWQYLMAASLLVTLPMVLVFLVFRRQFVENNVSSAIKG